MPWAEFGRPFGPASIAGLFLSHVRAIGATTRAIGSANRSPLAMRLNEKALAFRKRLINPGHNNCLGNAFLDQESKRGAHEPSQFIIENMALYN